jgi:hypothetical protein
MKYCLYTLPEEKREEASVKALIRKCRRRLEQLHGQQLV